MGMGVVVVGNIRVACCKTSLMVLGIWFDILLV